MDRIYRIRRERLRQAASERFGEKGMQRQLAEYLGRDANYISRMLSTPDKKGHKRIGEELAREFEQQLKKPAYWLDGIFGQESGAAPMPPVDGEHANTVAISYYPDVHAAAGHGCIPVTEATVTMIEMARSFLEREGIQPDLAVIAQASGDSMKGTVDDGDFMVINTGDREPRDGKVYVVTIDEAVLVKRVQRIPRGIKLISDNQAYDSITIMDEDQDTIVNVVGRVKIAWHRTI